MARFYEFDFNYDVVDPTFDTARLVHRALVGALGEMGVPQPGAAATNVLRRLVLYSKGAGQTVSKFLGLAGLGLDIKGNLEEANLWRRRWGVLELSSAEPPSE